MSNNIGRPQGSAAPTPPNTNGLQGAAGAARAGAAAPAPKVDLSDIQPQEHAQAESLLKRGDVQAMLDSYRTAMRATPGNIG